MSLYKAHTRGLALVRKEARKLCKRFRHGEILESTFNFFIQIFTVCIELSQNAAVRVAVIKNNRLSASVRTGIIVGDLHFKVGINTAVLVVKKKLPHYRLIVMAVPEKVPSIPQDL